MNPHIKIKLLVIPFLLLLFLPKSVFAQVPPPVVSCSDTRNPEFNSLRPYQASPCKPNVSETAGYCGNRLVIADSVGASSPISPSAAPNCQSTGGGNYRCTYRVHKTANFSVSLNDVMLPILGNTEGVANSQSQNETIDDAAKTNEYVSWYLNGVIGRAEYPQLSMDEEQDIRKLVDFSGPLQKLLPQEKLNDYRANTVKQAVRSKTQNAGIRHDQIIGCTYEVLGLGKIPGPCYESGLQSLISVERKLSEWSNHIPPRASDYNDFLSWWADYERWRGKFCFTPVVPSWVPVIGGKTILFCGENPFSPNYYAALFNNIPLSSTEDRKGSVSVGTTAVSSTPDVKLTNVVFSGVTPATLYFAHTEEVAELANILQYTFVPKDVPQTGAASLVSPSESCDLTNIRTNEGDNLFADQLSGTVNYDTEFTCDYGPRVVSQSCQKNINVGLGVVTNTPKAEEIWQRLVAGPASVFKRIFPLLGGNGSLGGILDIPAATKVTSTGSNLASASNPGGRAGHPTELYFAHIGGVSEYFLKGIQTMLRPKGFGEQIVFGLPEINVSSGAIDCDQNAPDIALSGALNKQDTYVLALNWVGGQTGTHALECYNDTVRRAREAGINAALTLWLWLHESNASNYNLGYLLDFGAASPAPVGYVAQINEFFARARRYTPSSPLCAGRNVTPIQAFAYIYKSGTCDPNTTDAFGVSAGDFYDAMVDQWSLISSCPFPTSPTDTSCP